MAYGQKGLADNWNKDHVIEDNVDFQKNQPLNMVLENRTDYPAGPVEGQVIMRTDYNNAFVWNGTAWRSLTPAQLIVVASDGSGDYLTIQEGIDALPAGGGIVHVKTGTYTITAPITFPNDSITLQGDGTGTLITTTTADINLIEVWGQTRIRIKDLYLYGDGLAKNNAGIEWVNTDSGSIENVLIENCGGVGLYMEGSDGNLILNPTIRDCWNWGIMLLECDGNTISNPRICDIVEDDFGEGIELNDSHRNIFDNCNVEGCEQEGIYFWASTYNNFEGGMVLNNSHGNVNVHAGIILDGNSTHNTILGNKSFDDKGVHTQRYGIREAGVGDNFNIITNNTCTDNITAEVSTQGPNTINQNNMVLP